MTNLVIYDRNGWLVRSIDNGWGYVLEHEGKSAWFQDDDAREFAAGFMDAAGWLKAPHEFIQHYFSEYSDIMQ